ncbi:MAG: LytR/AlgR family response regulator transcription factor [Prolixibacteraceae bacterium]
MEKKITYLIVEDEEKSREILLKKITMCNIPNIVCTGMAANAREALMLSQLNPPDFLLLDINLPGMNGFELIEELNQRNLYPRVIFTSAHTESEILLKALKISPVNYIVKPIDLDELEEAILKVCSEDKIHKHTKFQRQKLQGIMGPIFVEPDQIVLIKSDGHYAELFLDSGEKLKLFQNLTSIEKMETFSNFPFFKPDRCHLINLNKIERIFNKSKECLLRANSDNLIIKVSKEGIKRILEKLDKS